MCIDHRVAVRLHQTLSNLSPIALEHQLRISKSNELTRETGPLPLSILRFMWAATAADIHNTVAMLVRCENETLNELLKRLDKTIGKFYADDEIFDEVNYH